MKLEFRYHKFKQAFMLIVYKNFWLLSESFFHRSVLFSAFLKLLFFLKIYFYYLFLLERRIYREERQRGRSSVRWFTPQVSATSNAMPIWSQEPLLGLPCGCRVPKLWAVLCCFPRPQAGSWKGSGASGIRTGAPIGSQTCKARTLITCATAPGPKLLCFDNLYIVN